jgi:hypothetical protein
VVKIYYFSVLGNRMNGARCCYLHIGTHKTGTSSIQRALALQPEKLAEAGWFFPVTGQWDRDSGQHGLAARKSSTSQRALLDSLISEISAIPQNIILSSEEFTCMLWHNPAGFQEMVDRLSNTVDQITVVLYLRRQTDFLESNYIERLKSRFCLDFSTYVRMRMHNDLAEFPLDYMKLVNRLTDIKGINIVVRAYNDLGQQSVLSDFLRVIGCPEKVQFGEKRVNVSPSLVESLKNFCRAQRQRGLSDEEERVIELLTLHLPERPRMDPATRRMLVQHFAPSNHALAMRFGVTALVEEISAERALGTWCGLNGEPPPDQDSLARATLDNLFSLHFVDIVEAVATRFARTEAAREQAQALAWQRNTEIEALRAELLAAQATLASYKQGQDSAQNAPHLSWFCFLRKAWRR